MLHTRHELRGLDRVADGIGALQLRAEHVQLVARPADTILVLISDLFEGGVEQELIARVSQLLAAGVTVIVLLAQ